MWAKLKSSHEEEMKQGWFRLPWRSLTSSEWVTSWGRRRRNRLADFWSKLCVGEHAGQVTSWKDELFSCSWFLDGVFSVGWSACSSRCSLTPAKVSTNLHPRRRRQLTQLLQLATNKAWQPGKTGSLTAWCTSSAAPRAVKMPTFGRVVVVFVSPFWQASPSDRNKSPLTLIAKKCGRYSPLSCVCVRSVPNEERINQWFFPVKPPF